MPSKATTQQGEIGTAAAAAAAAAAGPAWRQFSFFESSPVRDADDFAKPPAALRTPNEVAAVCQCPVRPPASALISTETTVAVSSPQLDTEPSTSSGKHPNSSKAARRQPCTLVGTIQGTIKVLEPETYQELISWDAFSSAGVAGRVTHLSCDTRGRVVSLGEEDSSRFPILRVWDLRAGRNPRQDPEANGSSSTKNITWMPRLLAEGKVQHGSRPHPIAAVTHTPSLSYLSVALADGTVLLIRGLETALMAAAGNAGIASAGSTGRPAPAIALPKFKVVFQPSSSDSGEAHEPVTALGLSEAAPLLVSQIKATSNAASTTTTPAYEPRIMHSSKGRKGAAARPRDPRISANTAAAQADAAVPPSAIHLFIVTLSRVLRYVVVGKGAGGSPAVLDDVGGALGCAAVIPPRSPASSAASTSALAASPQSSSAQTTTGSAGKMVIARDEAIYVIGQEGREACFAYEGPKSSIHLSASQVIIVSPPFTPTSSNRGYSNNRDSPITTPTSRKGSMTPSEIARITIFDLDNKLVAFTGTFESGIRQTWVGPTGEVLVLSDTGEVVRLDEKPLRAKLDVLYRKSLFLLAVNLARSHMQRASSPDVLARIEALMGGIYQRYGDHLYNKGDYDGAMAQYAKTIGHTQPSFVIRRFLDAQRIGNLTTYLQELHAQGLASSDHTTLLLNCYTKLKDVASLDRFIKRPHAKAVPSDEDQGEGEGAAEDRDELPFDLETAMRVCGQAGYFGHAAYLAKRYGEHREYLRIQIEDVKDYSDALLYVRGLEAEDAISSMAQYAKTLLAELPDETTELLIELCSGAFQPDPDAAQKALRLQQGEMDAKKPAKSAAAAYLSYLQVGGFGKQTTADAPVAGSRGGTGSNTPAKRHSQAEPYAINDGSTRPNSTVKVGEADTSLPDADATVEDEDETEKMQAYPIPSPRTYFAHFIQHPKHFTRFLETVALARWGQVINMEFSPPADAFVASTLGTSAREVEKGGEELDEVAQALRELGLDSDQGDEYEDQEVLDQKSVWNTLLELYLTSSTTTGKNRALKLLEQHHSLPYDTSHALMLCAVESFNAGLILLYERLGMYEDVMRLHMDNAVAEEEGASGSRSNSSAHVIAALHKYGEVKPELYDMVLRFLVSSQTLLERHTQDLLDILTRIRDDGLMSTLEIVQVLGTTAYTHVGVVREFLISSISSILDSTASDTAVIQDYKSSTEQTLQEVGELMTDVGGARVFQMTRCHACAGQLDLPSVHFMCKHSYHQRCLGEEEAECPSCAEHQGRVRELRRRQAMNAVEVVESARQQGVGVQGVIEKATCTTTTTMTAGENSSSKKDKNGDGFGQLATLFGQPIMAGAFAAQML
ncbi:related to PEP5 - vacuolar biogenesis protein [Melanopsichium pennsylvanicum]|uniref:Related to PEP5 - vacuolar biogenesis protein n=2 Tax=Melanopsichium pennsylvanicum TaxID=63383 RepID=A0AAJ4XN25_9BASI|nr:related to PEP5-vacuolar biogenesis protein [Melanopsichium pennsylvanicum 4]SNX85173.1 related to PEP5 - vacuolar biogenesis protein [Melanopsichium pennsylvanicum]